MAENLNKRLRRIFESRSSASEPRAYQNVRNLYQSCMETDAINNSSISEVMVIIQELGGWPVLEGDGWEGRDFKWLDMAIRAWQKGFDFEGLIDIKIEIDSKDATKRILEINQPNLGLSREYLVKGLEDKDVKAYLKYMTDMSLLLGAPEDVARKDMKDVLDLEIEVAKICLAKEERRNKTALYNPIAVKDISTLYALPWMKHLNSIVTIEENELVNVAVPSYLRNLDTLLANTPVRTIANLLMWRHVQFSVDFLAEEAAEIKLDFNKILHGTGTEFPRWEICVKKTAGIDQANEYSDYYFYKAEGSLTNAVGAMYAKEHFPPSSKQLIDEIVENIRDEFRLILQELDWMDEETRARALKKADLITPHIAYSKEILDDELLDEYYKGFVLNGTSYLANILQLKKRIFAYYVTEFRKPIDKQSWKTHGGAAIANAFYSAEENSMVFPAGILDGVFFKADRPLYMNYGGIGVVVGHEITHGFDDEGSQKDADGSLVDWWEPETKKHYLEKTQCVIDQYSNYTVQVGDEMLHVNGINTQGENVADIGGVKEALRTYIKLVERY